MKKCPSCGMENKPSAKFCGGCGASLPDEPQTLENRASAVGRSMKKCSSCGTENKPSAKFCGGCGAPLPDEPQTPENKASAAWPAEKASGGKKSFRIKAILPALALVIAVALFIKVDPLHSCADCDEIRDLQKEYQAALKKNEDNSLQYNDFDRWNAEVSALANEIQILQNHECSMPVRKVKNKEYSYGRYMGSYTGEWKSTAPCGEGIFSGSYMDGSTQRAVAYSGEWSGGAPNGTGAMVDRWEYLGAGMPENWTSKFYEGTFVNGKLTGSGWTFTESSSGSRYEYYGGVYRDGFLEGQASFQQYMDGELYDQGTVEGDHYTVIYSERQELINAMELAGGIVVGGIASKYLLNMLDTVIGGVDPNSALGRELAEQHERYAASLEEWQAEKEREKTEKQLYDNWKALEADARWCATSSHEYERKHTEYFAEEAEKAKKEYNQFRGTWG